MTTPADELRAAAQTLHTLLAAPDLTPGPWLSLDHGDRLLYDGPGAEDQPPVYVVDEPMSNGANAAYIAAMHPGVGLALADWLAKLADFCDGVERTHGKQPPADNLSIVDALAVARAINGAQQ